MDWLLIAAWGDTISPLFSFLKAAFGLGLVIFVHELGHFLVAKACGVKCEKFYVGFDVPIRLGPFRLPSALFRKQWGETEYGLGIIPLGGYVKMLGQDDNPAHAAQEADRIRILKEDAGGTSVGYDPRSYPAKSVPQRMAIISAGVIMNLIFAVIFAAVAYRSGAEYTPAVISRTVPGSPAWRAGMLPGDKILQVGKDQPRDEELSFERDLMVAVTKTLASRPLELRVARRDGTEHNLVLLPEEMSDDTGSRPKIGASPPWGDSVLVADETETAAVRAGLKSGDRVVAAACDGQSWTFRSAYDFAEILARFPDQELQLTVERAAARAKDPNQKTSAATENTRNKPFETVVLRLPPQPARDPGLVMTWGEVTAVRKGSPAEEAGFLPGDRIVRVDGEVLRDPLLLDDFLRRRLGKPVSVVVSRTDTRGEAAERTLTVTPVPPPQIAVAGPGYHAAAETIGLAFRILDTVAEVIPGSPAAIAGVRPGDTIRGVSFHPGPSSRLTPRELRKRKLNEIALTGGGSDWPYIYQFFQSLPSGLEVELQVERDGNLQSLRMPLTERPESFDPLRGIYFKNSVAVRKASTWTAALSLGIRETRQGIEQVIFILRNLGSLFQNLGGPLMIATAGTQAASLGLPELLLFLCLLSANLAVLNMLPIPILDGGHMVFLAYEGIIGKPMNERISMGLTMLGLFFILGLMVFVFGMDIYRLITW